MKSPVDSRETICCLKSIKRDDELLTHRNSLELWLERRSHIMAFFRTLASMAAAGLTVVVLYRVW
jgi:hypothetical protein